VQKTEFRGIAVLRNTTGVIEKQGGWVTFKTSSETEVRDYVVARHFRIKQTFNDKRTKHPAP